MQALHFAFGIGAFIAPLIAQPFLSTTNSTALLQGNVPVLVYNRESPFNTTLDRTRRDVMNINETLENITMTRLENGTTNIQMNFTTFTPSTTTIGPIGKKPMIVNSDLIHNEHLDGDNIGTFLKEHKNIDQMVKEQKAALTPTPKIDILDTVLKNDTEEKDSKRLDEGNADLNLTSSSTSENLTSSVVEPGNSTNIDSSNTTLTKLVVTTKTTPPSTTPTTTLTSTTTPTTTTIPTTTSTPTTTTIPTTTNTPTTTATPTTTTPTTTPIPTTKKPTLTQSSTTKAPTPTKKVTPKTKITPNHKEVPDPTATITEDHTTSNMSETSTIHILTTTAHKPKTSVGDFLNSMIDSVKNMSRIQFAYSIVSLLLFVSSTLFLVLYCFTKRRRYPEETEDFKEISMHVENNCVRVVTLILSFFFFLCYVGMETTFGGLIMTFAVEFAHWTKPQGAIVTAIFWGSLAVGRGFAIFISNCCKPRTMLIIDLFFTIIGTLILAFGVQQLDILLWLGTVFLGIGLSSIFPTSVNWVEQYFKITGKSTAVFVTGSAIGQMVFPVVTGYFYQNYNKQYLMYIILCLSIVTVILYIIMQCLASKSSSMKTSNGFLRLDDLDPDMDNTDYNSTRDSERRKFMPVHNGYDLLLQDAEEEF